MSFALSCATLDGYKRMINRAGARHQNVAIGGSEGSGASTRNALFPGGAASLYWHHGIASMEVKGVMERGEPIPEGGSALFVRPTVLDAGIRVLYFFTSHMVIRAIYSIGLIASTELSVFFLSVIASVIAAHLLSKAAAAGAPVRGIGFGDTGGQRDGGVGATPRARVDAAGGGRGAVRVGRLAGACRVDHRHLDASTIHASRPESALVLPRSGARGGPSCLFSVPLRQLVPDTIAQGSCCAAAGDHRVHHPRRQTPPTRGDAPALGEGTQALQVLVAVAAAFAIGCSVTVVFWRGRGTTHCHRRGLTTWCCCSRCWRSSLMAFCCWLMAVSLAATGALSPAAPALVLSFCRCAICPVLHRAGDGRGGHPVERAGRAVRSNVWCCSSPSSLTTIRDSGVRHPAAGRGADVRAPCASAS